MASSLSSTTTSMLTATTRTSTSSLLLAGGRRRRVQMLQMASSSFHSSTPSSSSLSLSSDSHKSTSSSSSIPPPEPQQQQDEDPNSHIKLLNPRHIHNVRMRALRKHYRAESFINEKQRQLELERERQEREEQKQRLAEDIKAFKALRSRSFDQMGSSSSDSAAQTVIEDALDNPVEKASTSSSTDDIASSLINPSSKSTTIDPHQQKIQQYKSLRRKTRFQTELSKQSDLSKSRLDSMLYLLHSTQSFITYDNLESRLKEAFGSTESSMNFLTSRMKFPTYDTVEAAALEKIEKMGAMKQSTHAQESTSTSTSKSTLFAEQVVPASSSSINIRTDNNASGGSNDGDANNMIVTRAVLLEDELKGTLGGKVGVDIVKEYIEHVEVQGGERVMRLEREEEVAAYRQEKERVLAEGRGVGVGASGANVGGGRLHARRDAAAAAAAKLNEVASGKQSGDGKGVSSEEHLALLRDLKKSFEDGKK
ncbi:hypothetical protein HDU76_001594 [Blyttiomyces sp. JEL0837]|nr:hypothetical protein HDU76_001594 [Blyttiomyces sp. JEL0837]